MAAVYVWRARMTLSVKGEEMVEDERKVEMREVRAWANASVIRFEIPKAVGPHAAPHN